MVTVIRRRKRFYSLFGTFCLSIALGSSCLGINKAFSQDRNELGLPGIKNYSPDDYASNPMNWGAVRDHRGILYLANLNGIIEYDGVTWRKIGAPVGSWTLSVACDSAGTIYAGMFGDFGYLTADTTGSMVYMSLLENVGQNDRDFSEIWRIHSTKAGVYFRSRQKIFLWSENKMRVFRTNSAYSLSSVLNDTFYVEERGMGLMKSGGDSLKLIPASQQYHPLHFLSLLSYDNKHRLICTTKGLFLFDGKVIKPFDTPVNDFIKKYALSSAIALSDGNYAFGTYQGGACIMDHKGKVIQLINKSNGLRDDDVKSLYYDSEGFLWMSLNSGLAKVAVNSPFTFYNEKQGLKGNIVSITRHQNSLYAATSQAVYYLDSERNDINPRGKYVEFKIPQFRPIKGITNQGFWLLSTENGLLAAVGQKGVYHIEGDKAKRIDFENTGAFVLSRSQKNRNIIYAGLKNGVEILENVQGKWIAGGRIKGVNEEIRTIIEDDDGSVWLGTVFQGVLKLKILSHDSKGWNAEVIRFNKTHGLPDGPINISRINGKLVFATHKGHRRFEEKDTRFYPDSSITPKLADTTLSAAWIEQNRFRQIFVWPLNDEGKPELWLGTPDNRNNVLIDENRFSYLKNFGIFHTTFTDKDSVVWIGCSTGLVRYNPKIIKSYDITYPVQIRHVSSILRDSILFAGGSSFNQDRLSLSYDDNSLRFEYSVPYFEETEENQYQYILKGFDSRWSNWTHETKKDYTNLAPDSYTFTVRPKNIYNKIGQIAHYSFIIQAPWYSSGWAYASYFIILFGLLFGSTFLMKSHLIKREMKQAELREAEIINHKNKELQEKNSQLEDILSRLQIAQNSLIESESRFRSVAESANDAIITADRTGNITFWNKMAESIFGYSKNEIMGKPLTILMPEKYVDAHLKGLKRFYSTGQERIMGQVVELSAINKEGKEFPIELTLANWETHDEKFVTGIVRDMTIRKQKEEALRNTQTQLFQSEKLSTLGKLSAGIAHELNNPAGSALRSSAQLQKSFMDFQRSNLEINRLNLSEEQISVLSDLDDRAKKYSKKQIQLDAPSRLDKEQEIEKWLESKGVDGSWEHAPALLNLDYTIDGLSQLFKVFTSRQFETVVRWLSASYTIYNLLTEISLGTVRIAEIVEAFKSYTYMDQAPLQKVDIKTDLENTLILFQSKLKGKINLIRDYEKNLPKIEAYGGQLNQVWTNIIDNAIDAMGSKGQLIIRTAKKEKGVLVEIIDNGPGIAEDIQSKIFDPFFTTKKIRAGTGLGLNISHNIIVQNHHGQLTFTSKPGKTSFVVQLPLKIETIVSSSI